MPRKQGDSGPPKIAKLTKKQIEDAAKARPAEGRPVVRGGITKWVPKKKR